MMNIPEQSKLSSEIMNLESEVYIKHKVNFVQVYWGIIFFYYIMCVLFFFKKLFFAFYGVPIMKIFTDSKILKRYRFWFDDVHFGVSVGYTKEEAFEYFKNHGFMEEDIFDYDSEIV